MLVMKSNLEFRNLAWKRLWASHWFGRLFGGELLLGLCGYAVNVVIGGILGQLGVQDWQDYTLAVMANRGDLTTPVPNLTNDYIIQATSATAFENFIYFIMAGIAAYGTAIILLRCLKDEENGWLGAAFGGFKDPFGMLWLAVRLVLIYLWRFLLLIVLPPLGVWLLIVAFYRYRYAWLIRAEHPDWSAGACLRSCKELMEGHKWQSFKLDCSYWKPITLVLLLLLVLTGAVSVTVLGSMEVLAGMLAFVTFFALMVSSVVLRQYIGVGQGLFYHDLKDGQTTEQNERNG